MAILLIFLALQLGDAATTLVFLARGVAEGNPLIGSLMHASNPAVALLVAKALAWALALFAWGLPRPTLLRRPRTPPRRTPKKQPRREHPSQPRRKKTHLIPGDLHRHPIR